jgi:hypothetical protein
VQGRGCGEGQPRADWSEQGLGDCCLVEGFDSAEGEGGLSEIATKLKQQESF